MPMNIYQSISIYRYICSFLSHLSNPRSTWTVFFFQKGRFLFFFFTSFITSPEKVFVSIFRILKEGSSNSAKCFSLYIFINHPSFSFFFLFRSFFFRICKKKNQFILFFFLLFCLFFLFFPPLNWRVRGLINSTVFKKNEKKKYLCKDKHIHGEREGRGGLFNRRISLFCFLFLKRCC